MRPGILKQALSIVRNLYIRRSCSFLKPEFWHRLGLFHGKALAFVQLVTILKWWPERELQRSKKHSTKTPNYGILIAFKDLFSFGLKVRQARRGGEKKGCLMDFQVSSRLMNRLQVIHGIYFRYVNPTAWFVLYVLELMVPEASTALPGLRDVLQPGGVSPLSGSVAAT